MGADAREPRATITDAARRRHAVDQLVQHVTSMLPLLTCRRDLASQHFSAMALARMNRLVAAMCLLSDQGFPDVVKTLGRSALETYVLGLYSLHGGQEALEQIQGDHVRSSRLTDLPDEVPGVGDVSHRFDGWEGPADRINWEDLIKNTLPRLLAEAEGEDAEKFGKMLYDQAYRAGSMLGTHAGVGTIGGHGKVQEGIRLVREVAHTVDDGTGDIVSGGAQLAMLTCRVFLVFGIGIDRAVELFSEIVEDTDIEVR